MTQRIDRWLRTASRSRTHTYRLTRYQRTLRRARRIEAARHPFDWNAYEPLPAGEDLEARDPVEREAWANLEAEARRRRDEQQGIRPVEDDDVLYDIDSLRALWREACREFELERCKRLKPVK